MFENVLDQTKRLTYAADMLLAAQPGRRKTSAKVGVGAQRRCWLRSSTRYQGSSHRAVRGGGEGAVPKGGIDQPVGFTGRWSSPRSSSNEAGSMLSYAIRRSWEAGRSAGRSGSPYREYLVQYLSEGKRGSADLCGYFFLRSCGLIRPWRGGRAFWLLIRFRRETRASPKTSVIYYPFFQCT